MGHSGHSDKTCSIFNIGKFILHFFSPIVTRHYFCFLNISVQISNQDEANLPKIQNERRINMKKIFLMIYSWAYLSQMDNNTLLLLKSCLFLSSKARFPKVPILLPSITVFSKRTLLREVTTVVHQGIVNERDNKCKIESLVLNSCHQTKT